MAGVHHVLQQGLRDRFTASWRRHAAGLVFGLPSPPPGSVAKQFSTNTLQGRRSLAEVPLVASRNSNDSFDV